MRSSHRVSDGPGWGDRDAIQNLIRSYLPLAYNIVGWALNGYPDVDRVAQAATIEAFQAGGQPGDTSAFRSRLVAACVRRVRQARQALGSRGNRFPDPDFVNLMVEHLGLGGEQRGMAQASRWLDDQERLLLALWWQEAAGTVTRADLANALREPPAALARYIGHLAESLQESRLVDGALRRTPVCGGLAAAAGGWDRRPAPAWRKRLAAHVIDCPVCLPGRVELSRAERLLEGLPLVPPSPSLVMATLRSILGDDLRAVGAGNAQRPPIADQRHSPSKSRHITWGRVRWTRSSLVAVSSGVVLCVLVATIVAVRMNGPSNNAAASGMLSTSSGGASPGAGTPVTGASGAHSGTSSAPGAAGGGPSGHKGVGVVAGTGVNTDLAASGASWYYNWSATPNGIDTPSGVAFVPMIKGPSNVNTVTLNQVKHEGNYLLGFNEPDVANEANLSVNQALALWPKLEATGMELGSPAVSYGTNKTTSWLGQFMTGARARGYRVNFITVHWYGQHHWTSPATNVSELKSYLEQTYALYHLPIWITEFSLINFSSARPVYPPQAQEAAFLTAATKMLDGLPFIQRYAWYTLTGAQSGGTTILYSDGGNSAATAVGRAYKEIP
jgi:hypothetical protein